MSRRLFLKLGGSLITDKQGVEALRADVLERLAGEVQSALHEQPDLQLVIGHGSGSFGHVAAAKHRTRQGVSSVEQWCGFAEVSAAAARLNKLVREALLSAGVPALTIQPSASAECDGGLLVEMATTPVKRAVDAGLVPLVYGDVAFDKQKGGTIISTEQVLSYLAQSIQPDWLLLAGETAGVYDARGEVISTITSETLSTVQESLGTSRGTDVTGGMASKVLDMLQLVENHPALSVLIFSGMEPGRLRQALLEPEHCQGTLINQHGD